MKSENKEKMNQKYGKNFRHHVTLCVLQGELEFHNPMELKREVLVGLRRETVHKLRLRKYLDKL